MPTTQIERMAPKRILVVEDDPLVAHTLQMALAVDGHTVDVAENGEQALQLFAQGDHDLVITDFKLPGMDGLELAQAIKERAATKPIILITAHADAIKGPMGKVSYVDLLMGKPVSVPELHAAIRKVLSAG